jgi:hypothetical protein
VEAGPVQSGVLVHLFCCSSPSHDALSMWNGNPYRTVKTFFNFTKNMAFSDKGVSLPLVVLHDLLIKGSIGFAN